MSQYQAYSRVVLYKQSKILPDRNFKVDDIATYLSTLTKVIISDYQYIKHSLLLDCKFDLSQTYLDYTQNNDFDYVAITNVVNNVDEKTVYYFIENKQWRSKNTVLCNLYMDTVNSFDGDYTISDKTKVLREHKDRWAKSGPYTDTQTQVVQWSEVTTDVGYYIFTLDISTPFIKVTSFQFDAGGYDYREVVDLRLVTINGVIHLNGIIKISTDDITQADFPLTITAIFDYGYMMIPSIDEYSEGVTPLLYKKKEEVIHADNLNWYLAYQTDTNSPEAVNVYLYPSESITCKTMNNITTSNIVPNSQDGIVIYPNYNDKKVTYYVGSKIVSPYSYTTQLGVYQIKYDIVYVLRNILGTIFPTTEYKIMYRNVNNTWQYVSHEERDIGWDGAEISIPDSTLYYYKFSGTFDPSTTPSYNNFYSLTSSSGSVAGINNADRTLSTYLKIIELPYCPVTYEYNSVDNEYIMPAYLERESFNEGQALYRLKVDINEFKGSTNLIQASVENPLSKLLSQDLQDVNPSTTNLRDDDYETKLLHSDYYRPKFVYDSFGYDFRLEEENADLISIVANVFKVTFKTNSAPSGALLFDFNEEVKKISFQDYDSVLLVNRNLDYPLYNSDYLNYIRTGYNYDIKNKKLANISSVISGGIGVIGGIGSIAGGIASANPAFVVGGISSIATSVAGTINSLARSELAIQQKLDEKKMQATSVASADDLDLLNYYADGNKAKICWYECSDKMKQAFADLFYYCGYATQEFKVPNVNTRSWFNYLQAELVISDSKNLGEEIIKDIISRYAIGITFLHHTNNTWDINQVKENWEVNLI